MAMTGRRAVSLVLVLAVTVFAPLGVRADSPKMTEADYQNDAAQTWLELIDQGKLQQSWGSAAEGLKSRSNASSWQKKLLSMRSALGPKVARGLDKKEIVSSVDGSPKGEYAVLTFTTDFANRQVIEKLTLVHDSDGKWRPYAYSVN